MKKISLLLAAVMCISFMSGCQNISSSEGEGSSKNVLSHQQTESILPQQSTSLSNEEVDNISSQIALDTLCLELYQRGIADYRGLDAEPYYNNVDYCMSSCGEFESSELFVFKIQTGTDSENYMIAAVSHDLKHFFQMSHVDGILYDIRDSPSYIHDGEYSADIAQKEIESYLVSETTIDPKQYDVYTFAEKIDGSYNYHIVLNEKNGTDWTQHAFEFYVSKDLKRIARIDYVDAMVESLQHVESITGLKCDGVNGDSFTIEEVKDILAQWIQKEKPNDSIVGQNEIEIGKGIFYQFRVMTEDGKINIYRISTDLFYADEFAVIETIGKVQQFTYLKEDK